jgi:uncharacterized protein YuzE
MAEIKYNYDQEADVLYVSFGRSEHVTGIEEIAEPKVFRVRPLNEYGTFMAIAELFEGREYLRKAVDELQVRLYATA